MTKPNRADAPAKAPLSSFNSFAQLFPVPGFTKLPGFDVTTVLDIQRRNVEALTAANQTIVQGLQTVVRRQGEIARQSAKQFQDLLSVKPSSTSVEETLVKQIDVAKTSYEKTVADARELGDLVAKVGSEASTSSAAASSPAWMRSRRQPGTRRPTAPLSSPDPGRHGQELAAQSGQPKEEPRSFPLFRVLDTGA
jgi:phasin family protein